MNYISVKLFLTKGSFTRGIRGRRRRKRGRGGGGGGKEGNSEDDEGEKVRGVRSLTSELLGKMGWFMVQLPLCKVLVWVEGPGSQDTRQDRHDCGDWKAREAEVVTSATAWGPRKKARGSLRSIWLPAPLTPSDRTSQAGRRRRPGSRRSPRPGSSRSASR